MKGNKFIFAVALVILGFCDAVTSNAATVSRSTVQRESNQNATSRNSENTVARSTASRGTVGRSTPPTTTVPRTIPNTTQRSGANTRNTTITPRLSSTRSTTKNLIGRIATNVADVERVLSKNYSKCRTVFNDCMDEFCANKDAQLKRCACSARIHEFDSTKKQLSMAEDKLLDFSQRLLTVNLDEEDALAINTATEGEEAFYNTPDTTASKRALDAIAKRLNQSITGTDFNTNVSTLTWSLNADSAFDSVNSLAGAATTAKTGTALYSAALPICRQMAAEVCSEDELTIAENGYQMMIEQDCTTVQKSYKSQYEQTKNRILESSALLDMSRLDIYQTRNSDDILTCKSKMLSMLTNPSVCDYNLGKCLDTTGRYINPATGEAFLTTDLPKLVESIKLPDANQTWASANPTFVSFLNSKRLYLEPATENCQDISNDVWNAFIEDALSQIRLAQIAKLEQIRQGCTTLYAECSSDAADSIANFDSRALSIFGISATKTANAICGDVLESCSAVMDAQYPETKLWTTGMNNITTAEMYNKLISTCREVGRSCIIQACTSVSGNFGLCEDVKTSVNRHSILNRYSCWDEVQECVKSVGDDNLEKIMTYLKDNGIYDENDYFYANTYGKTYTKENNPKIDDLCASNNDDAICRLTEKLWGNCEDKPTTTLAENGKNSIIKPTGNETTLLYWFAQNTWSQNNEKSCSTEKCQFYCEGECDKQEKIENGTKTYKSCTYNSNECATDKNHSGCEPNYSADYTIECHTGYESINQKSCTAKTYTVTLNANGGTNDSATVEATYNEAMPAITIPTKSNYTFSGYYDAQNCEGTMYYNTDGLSARTWNKNSDTTLYACWQQIICEENKYLANNECKICPTTHPNSDAGSTSQEQCYKQCDDINITNGIQQATNSKAYYANNCEYTTTCDLNYTLSDDGSQCVANTPAPETPSEP